MHAIKHVISMLCILLFWVFLKISSGGENGKRNGNLKYVSKSDRRDIDVMNWVGGGLNDRAKLDQTDWDKGETENGSQL